MAKKEIERDYYYFDRCRRIRKVATRNSLLTKFPLLRYSAIATDPNAWLNQTLEFCGPCDGQLQLSILQEIVDRTSCCSDITNVEFRPLRRSDDLVFVHPVHFKWSLKIYKKRIRKKEAILVLSSYIKNNIKTHEQRECKQFTVITVYSHVQIGICVCRKRNDSCSSNRKYKQRREGCIYF